MANYTSPSSLEIPLADEDSELDKLNGIRDLLTTDFDGQLPDILICNAGGIARNGDGGDYRTLAYSNVSEHGIATGSRTRIIATAEIAVAVPEIAVMTNSYNGYDANEPTMSSVAKSELVKRGVDADRISEETKSFSTITELTEMVKLSVAESWGRITMLTNEYHIPRMIEMFDHLDTLIKDPEFQNILSEFKQSSTQVSFLGAEPVMRLAHRHYASYIDRVEATPQFAYTLDTEDRGLRDLKAGKYVVNLEPKHRR